MSKYKIKHQTDSIFLTKLNHCLLQLGLSRGKQQEIKEDTAYSGQNVWIQS